MERLRDGQAPVQQVGPLVKALEQIPEVHQVTEQVHRVGEVARQVVDVAERIVGRSDALDALADVAQVLAGGLMPIEKVQFKFESSADPGGTWRAPGLRRHEHPADRLS